MKNSDLLTLFGDAPEKVLSYLFDRLPVGTAVIDREFRLRRCNPTWAEFIERYTPSAASDALPGVSLFDLEPGTEDVLKPLFAPVFAGEIVRQEGIRLESDGIVSYWDVVLVPLEVDGEVVAALDVSMDVTSHMLSQQKLENTLQALQESEANLRAMLENAQGYAIYRAAVDLDHPFLGRVILVSPSMREVAGVEDIYDFTSWFSNIHPDDEARVIAANQRAIENGVSFDEEMRFYNKQRDEWRWVHTVSNPTIDENGRLTHFNGMTIDITEQKQAQEALSNINQTLERQVAQRTQEIEQRNNELEVLYQADEELLQHLELDAILQSLVDVAVNALQADKSSIMVWDAAHEHLMVRASHGFHPHTLTQMSFGSNEGSVGRAATTGELIVVEDAQLNEQVIKRIIEAEDIRSFMHFPITVGQKIFGVFNVNYVETHRFSKTEQRLFMALAQRAALAIENARLYLAEQRRRQVAESLRGIVRILNSSHPLPEILDYIVTQASQLINADICTLHHIDYAESFVRIEASHGLPEAVQDIDGFPLLSSRSDELILKREVVAVSNQAPPVLDPMMESELDPRVRRWRAALTATYPAFLAVPLIVADEVYGSLVFHFGRHLNFDQETIDLAMSLSEQAALAIDNAGLRIQAEQAAVSAERNRLARDLHDAVTQTLFSTSLIADVLPRIWERDPEMGQAKLSELRELTRGALAEMRTLLLELRPATLTEVSLAELLRQLTQAIGGRSRLPIELIITGERPLPPETQIALYRIAQEALNNISKHASASQVTLTVDFLPQSVRLTIADNGRGFNPDDISHTSLGLGIMQERAQKIGAELTIHSQIGEGTTVTVHCPIANERGES